MRQKIYFLNVYKIDQCLFGDTLHRFPDLDPMAWLISDCTLQKKKPYGCGVLESFLRNSTVQGSSCQLLQALRAEH